MPKAPWSFRRRKEWMLLATGNYVNQGEPGYRKESRNRFDHFADCFISTENSGLFRNHLTDLAGSEFVGFYALEAVGGEINIESNRNLKTIEFPHW
jgi:hypothetical protein